MRSDRQFARDSKRMLRRLVGDASSRGGVKDASPGASVSPRRSPAGFCASF